MADTRITDLTAITGANTAAGDQFVLVDVSDTTMAASGTDKKISKAELLTVFEAAGAAAAAQAASQPVDSDLTAIAALSTTAYGRAFLTLANQAATMALLSAASDTASGIVELATNAETATGTDTTRAVTPANVASVLASYLTTSAAAAGYQPLDSDLTAIAALTTTSYGRAFLALANQAALMALLSAASDTASGIVELATTAETTTGTDTARAVTPAGLLNATTASNINARIGVEKAGSLVGTRRRINFIDGTNVTITVADDAANEEVDVTIAASGGGSGSVATDTIFDAKGDLAIGTGADTAAKLTVGANGQVMFADSNASTGLTYGYPEKVLYAAAGAIHYPIGVFGQSAQTAATAQECTWWPIFLNRRVTLDAISNWCWTLEAGSTLRLGVYAAGANATPTTLTADYGTVSGASTGSKSATGSTAIGPGLVFIAAWQSNHTTVRWSRSSPPEQSLTIFGENGVAGGQFGLCWKVTGVDYSAGLPANAPALSIVYSSAGATTAICPGIRFT